jgi:hypothetical protein
VKIADVPLTAALGPIAVSDGTGTVTVNVADDVAPDAEVSVRVRAPKDASGAIVTVPTAVVGLWTVILDTAIPAPLMRPRWRCPPRNPSGDGDRDCTALRAGIRRDGQLSLFGWSRGRIFVARGGCEGGQRCEDQHQSSGLCHHDGVSKSRSFSQARPILYTDERDDDPKADA